jgi:hypothetical protein
MATAGAGITFGAYGVSNSPSGTVVQGYAPSTGGESTVGVTGYTNDGANGVLGPANAMTGLNFGVQGISVSSRGVGVQGSSPDVAVAGFNQVCSTTCKPVAGTAEQFVTVSGGIVLQGLVGTGFTQVFSVDSNGDLSITGYLTKSSGSYKIGHPLDPSNKYLSHSLLSARHDEHLQRSRCAGFKGRCVGKPAGLFPGFE